MTPSELSRFANAVMLLFSLAGCASSPERADEIESPARPVVQGRVLIDGQPVEGAHVCLFLGPEGAWEQCRTRADGRFVLTMVKGPGTYEVSAQAPDGRCTEMGQILVTASWGEVVTCDVDLTLARVLYPPEAETSAPR